MRVWASLLVCTLLAACATPHVTTAPPEALFQDHLFAPPADRIGADDIFALSDSMRRYVQTEIVGQLRNKDRLSALIDALYRKGRLKLEYDAASTRNASEAFEARAGNCLSLVIMTAAFAKELGLPVQYRSAYLEEVWSRSNNFLLRSGHVNVTVGHRFADMSTNPLLSPLTIDFLPPEEISGLRTREVTEQTVIAMYMNNRAAEALVDGRFDDAYAWARAAIHENPGFVSPYNTLGVIYLRHGDLGQAALVFGHVLEHEPENTRAMSNLAEVLSRQGRVAEAASLRNKLAQLEPEPPFHYFNLGLAAMKKNEFGLARAMFAKEVARADYNPEFHFWLGLANFRLGDVELARKHLSLAMENSTTRADRDLYAAKLAWLRAHGRR
jgi:tetratricopeptide (TPR) repeat protein